MVSKLLLITAAIAYVEARFGQENLPIAAISAVQGGDPGAAATVAGATISDLLGGANSCAKLQRADQVVTELGGGADAIAAAIGLVAAEKNTNPFANGNVQNVCGDPSLPATAELRGITPLIDPAVDVNGAAAALSKSSSTTPLNADGLSVFDLMSQAGLGDLVASQAAGGGAAAGGNAGGNNQQANNQNQNQGNAGNNNQQAAAGNDANQQANNNQGQNQANNNQQAGGANQNANAGNSASCNAGNANNGTQSADQSAGSANNNNQNAGNSNNQNAGNNNANQGQDQNQNQQGQGQGQGQNQNQNQQNAGNNNNQNAGNAGNAGNANQGAGAANGAADFGKCTPTIDLQAGRAGRKADEQTFQITDPLARGGQSDALNPNIITNALCNQLTNVCDANAAAVAACEDAKAQVQAAGTRDQSTVDLFNGALGFGGAAKRGMRRGLRL